LPKIDRYSDIYALSLLVSRDDSNVTLPIASPLCSSSFISSCSSPKLAVAGTIEDASHAVLNYVAVISSDSKRMTVQRQLLGLTIGSRGWMLAEWGPDRSYCSSQRASSWLVGIPYGVGDVNATGSLTLECAGRNVTGYNFVVPLGTRTLTLPLSSPWSSVTMPNVSLSYASGDDRMSLDSEVDGITYKTLFGFYEMGSRATMRATSEFTLGKLLGSKLWSVMVDPIRSRTWRSFDQSTPFTTCELYYIAGNGRLTFSADAIVNLTSTTSVALSVRSATTNGVSTDENYSVYVTYPAGFINVPTNTLPCIGGRPALTADANVVQFQTTSGQIRIKGNFAVQSCVANNVGDFVLQTRVSELQLSVFDRTVKARNAAVTVSPREMLVSFALNGTTTTVGFDIGQPVAPISSVTVEFGKPSSSIDTSMPFADVFLRILQLGDKPVRGHSVRNMKISYQMMEQSKLIASGEPSFGNVTADWNMTALGVGDGDWKLDYSDLAFKTSNNASVVIVAYPCVTTGTAGVTAKFVAASPVVGTLVGAAQFSCFFSQNATFANITIPTYTITSFAVSASGQVQVTLGGANEAMLAQVRYNHTDGLVQMEAIDKPWKFALSAKNREYSGTLFVIGPASFSSIPFQSLVSEIAASSNDTSTLPGKTVSSVGLVYAVTNRTTVKFSGIISSVSGGGAWRMEGERRSQVSRDLNKAVWNAISRQLARGVSIGGIGSVSYLRGPPETYRVVQTQLWGLSYSGNGFK